MTKIVTFGEILLRLSTKQGNRLSQTGELNLHYGGAEANVGVSLANFGHDVYFVSKVPNNPLGTAVERHLKTYRVHTDFLLKGGERLGAYYVESGVGERSAQVTYDRKYSSFTELTMEEIDFDEVFHEATLFHLSGITPALSPSLNEIVLFSLKKAKEYGVTTSIDFNYRSKLWSQQEAGKTLKRLLSYVDICSCGELDAVYLLGIEKANHSLEEKEKLKYYYDKIQELYPNILYLSSTFRTVISASTNKLQGNLYTKGDLYQSKIHHIDHIVDRVGGGDAFAAGILHGIIENMLPEQTVSFATAASALKHTLHGDCNNFSKAEIETFSENAPGKIVR
jgi:2-dehydro-3-deoxygluconokinase